MKGKERLPPPLTTWWSRNRGWAGPAGCLALFLPALSLASCLGAVLTFALSAVQLGLSLRRRDEHD